MLPYAYTHDGDCKLCGKKHHYLTNNHIVMIASKEDLEKVALPFKIEMHDPAKSDIKRAQHIFGMWPELER